MGMRNYYNENENEEYKDLKVRGIIAIVGIVVCVVIIYFVSQI